MTKTPSAGADQLRVKETNLPLLFVCVSKRCNDWTGEKEERRRRGGEREKSSTPLLH